MKEFIQELKHNQKIKGTETVRIDYIIERLEDILKAYNKYLNERIKFLNGAVEYFIDTDEETALKYMYERCEVEAIQRVLNGGQDEENN